MGGRHASEQGVTIVGTPTLEGCKGVGQGYTWPMARLKRQTVKPSAFNPGAEYPFSLRQNDFEIAMQDVYDFLHDVNGLLLEKGLHRLEEMLRGAALSGTFSDMLRDSLAKHARGLVRNMYHNGHPDLIQRGAYANDSVQSGELGIEVKSTKKPGGAVDLHGPRDHWMCVFVYLADHETEPARERRPTRFTEVYLAKVEESDFRINKRGRRGTPTATLHAQGLEKMRPKWIYLDT
jgi:hypothetical protein